MKVQHLSRIIDIDPQQAACENRIVRMLYKHRCGVRQNKLFQLTCSGRLGEGIFKRSISRLVDEEDIVTRLTTNHASGFLLKLTPWGEQLALELENILTMQKGVAA